MAKGFHKLPVFLKFYKVQSKPESTFGSHISNLLKYINENN